MQCTCIRQGKKKNNFVELTTTITKATVEKLLPNFVTICLENSPRLTIQRINTTAPDNHCITSWTKLYKSWKPVNDLPEYKGEITRLLTTSSAPDAEGYCSNTRAITWGIYQ
jgi:hypothetical protein